MKRCWLIFVLCAGGCLTLYAGFAVRKPAQAQVKPPALGLLGPVPVPVDNPQTPEKIALGRQLFFEGRLSSDGTISCASCHEPDRAWADTTPVSAGVAHKLGSRNTPSVINEAYSVPQFWDGRALHLEKQAVGPVQNPIEMDLTAVELEYRLNHLPGYVAQFQQVFGGPPTIDTLAKAIASFERTVISSNTGFDRYLRGERTAMNPAALRGMQLFNGKGNCLACHNGPTFSDANYHNLGVGYTDGKYADVGRFDVTHNARDMGAFKTPMLRNVSQTAPYLHDGSVKTLRGVIDLYDRGGIPNPHLDAEIKPLKLTNREKGDLVAFLTALNGPYPVVSAPPLPNPEITAQQLRRMMQAQAR